MKQLRTSYIAEESTLLSRPGSKDAAPSVGIAALARAGQDAAHKGAHTSDGCLATGITPATSPPRKRNQRKKEEAWAQLLIENRCGERADSKTMITASHRQGENERSLSATVTGKGNTSPSAQA
jgi:hypothetical protein